MLINLKDQKESKDGQIVTTGSWSSVGLVAPVVHPDAWLCDGGTPRIH